MSDSKYESLKLKNQLCFPLYAASRQVTKMYRKYLSPLDLTYTQYITMLVLWEEELISAGELGRRLYLDSGTLTPVLKSLEAKGLIKRYRAADDERVLTVELTAEGRELQAEALKITEKQKGEPLLDEQEKAELYRLLYKILSEEEK